MFVYQVLLFVGSLATVLLAISAACPLPEDQPINGC